MIRFVALVMAVLVLSTGAFAFDVNGSFEEHGEYLAPLGWHNAVCVPDWEVIPAAWAIDVVGNAGVDGQYVITCDAVSSSRVATYIWHDCVLPPGAYDIYAMAAGHGQQASSLYYEVAGFFAEFTVPPNDTWSGYTAYIETADYGTLYVGCWNDADDRLYLDNIMVIPLAVPEPASMSVLLVCIAAMCGAWKRWA